MGLLSWLGLAPDQDNLAAGLDADRRNADLSLELWKRGLMSDAAVNDAWANYQFAFEQLLEDEAVEGSDFQNAAPAGEWSFFSGQVEQQARANDKGFFSALWWGLKIVPIWVWIGAAIALFLWMGGGVWLVKRPKGRLAQ
jgi:hypothetical protein